MIVYFLDKNVGALDMASTYLNSRFKIVDDSRKEDIESGHTTFDIDIQFNDNDRITLQQYTTPGNFLLRNAGDEDGNSSDQYSVDGSSNTFVIIDREINAKEKTIHLYAEDASLRLLNDVGASVSSEEHHTVDWYLDEVLTGTGFYCRNIYISDEYILNLESASTITEQLNNIAAAFNCELEYGFDIEGLKIVYKWIDVYPKRGVNTEEIIQINREADNITVSESVGNLVTALYAVGTDDITLDDYVIPEGEDENGDLFIENGYLVSLSATVEWSNESSQSGYYRKSVSFDAYDEPTLFRQAKEYLLRYKQPEINYDVDISDVELPYNLSIGDRVNIVDDVGEIYISGRVLEMEISITNATKKFTLGDFKIRSSGISDIVRGLSLDMLSNRAWALKAREEAQHAVITANDAEEQATQAVTLVGVAQTAANRAIDMAEEAGEAAISAIGSAARAEQSAKDAENAADYAIEMAGVAQGAADYALEQAGVAYDAAQDAIADAREAAAAAEGAGQSASVAQAAANAALEASYRQYGTRTLTNTQIATQCAIGYEADWARQTGYYWGDVDKGDILVIYVTRSQEANTVSKLLIRAENDTDQGESVHGTVIGYDDVDAYFWHDNLGAHIVGSKTGFRTDLDGTGMKITDGSTGKIVAEFGSSAARVGSTDGPSFKMNADNLQAFDDDGNKYFEVSENGIRFGSLGKEVATKTEVQQAQTDASDALEAAESVVARADSGEFKGEKGDKGDPGEGKDGYTPYIKDGYWFINGVSTEVKAEGTDGIDGVDGNDGVSIVWKGSFSSPPLNPQNGWAYYNTVDKKSYVRQSGTWYQMTIDGAPGTDGVDGKSIIWKGESSNPPTNPQVNWCYRDSDNGIIYIYNGTAWTIMAKDGSDGEAGAPGTDGVDGNDGLSVYITYHDNPITQTPAIPTGSGSSGGWHTNPTSDVKWISQKIAESASSGTWGTPIVIKGATGDPGEKGDKGDKGDDGTSYYTYIRYSKNANGNPMVTSPTSETKYIGIYSGTSSTAPISYTLYTWSKYSGTDGAGITSISNVIKYAVGSSPTTPPSASAFVEDYPPETTTENPYIWTRVQTTQYINSVAQPSVYSYSVSSTMDSFEVGGRNLLAEVYKAADDTTSEIKKEYISSGTWHVYGTNTTANVIDRALYTIQMSNALYTNGYFTLSGDVDMTNISRVYVTKKLIADPETTSEVLRFTDYSGAETFYVSPNEYIRWIGVMVKANATLDITVQLKLENGNVATVWTPAPEDIDLQLETTRSGLEDYIGEMDTSYSEKFETLTDDVGTIQTELTENISPAIEKHEADIQMLNDSFRYAIKYENGETAMELTDDGWSFNISKIISPLNANTEKTETLESSISNAEVNIDALQNGINAISEKTTYMTVTEEDGQPCIELGASDSDFKIRITNTEIKFLDGDSIPAYISNQTLHISQAEVESEMDFGNFAWINHGNGSMGLIWKEI